MPQPKTTLRLALTTAQKVQIRLATGRDVSVLELRLQDGLEPAAGPPGETVPEFPAALDQEPAPEPAARRSESRQRPPAHR